MAKKKPVSKKIGRVRHTEKGLMIQPTRKKVKAPGQKANRREADLHEDEASYASTDSLNIVGTAAIPSVNQTKDERLNDQWSFDHSLCLMLDEGLFLARERLKLIVAERNQKTISRDQITEKLKGLSDMMKKMTATLAVLTEQESSRDE